MARVGFGTEPINRRGSTRRPPADRACHGRLTRSLPNIVARYALPALLTLTLLLATPSPPARAVDGSAPAANSLPEPRDPAIRDRERQALIAFYNAMSGPDWIEHHFWGSDRPVGQWHGVTTDADGRIVQLTIYDNNVTGKVSAAVCKLERLHTLHLSFNNLSGALPDLLGDCRALKNLWLKGNKITGRLPDSVAVLPELEYLDIHANSMSGPLPAKWDTPKLTIFRGDDNRISGALPEQLLRQPRLEKLMLHNNKLTGAVPATLSASLASVLLSNNALSGPIPEGIGKLKKLTDFRLNRNQLSGPIPADLADAPSLQVLRLDHNRLRGAVPAGLAKRLMVFDASNNPDLQAAR
jgi:Leucine-rich repeat (LRR) protein